MNWRELKKEKVSGVQSYVPLCGYAVIVREWVLSVEPTLTGLLLALTVTIFGCSGIGSAACPDGMEDFVSHQLFMGRSIADGDVVSDADWDSFLADIVTPRFPDGLTVLDGRGQWRNSAGVIEKEQSKVLIILAPQGEDAMRLIDEVSDEYKSRFNQESVLRVVEDACVAF